MNWVSNYTLFALLGRYTTRVRGNSNWKRWRGSILIILGLKYVTLHFLHGQYNNSEYIFQSSFIVNCSDQFWCDKFNIFFVQHILKDYWPIFYCGYRFQSADLLQDHDFMLDWHQGLVYLLSTLISPIQPVTTNNSIFDFSAHFKTLI